MEISGSILGFSVFIALYDIQNYNKNFYKIFTAVPCNHFLNILIFTSTWSKYCIVRKLNTTNINTHLYCSNKLP